MDIVQGIGGVFLYARNAEALADWYREHLGLELHHWGDTFGCEFPSQDTGETGRRSTTTFAIFPHAEPDTLQAPTARLNFRVPDVEGLLERLRRTGAKLEDEQEHSAYGHFAWVYDPEGNKVELWQPPRIGEGWPDDDDGPPSDVEVCPACQERLEPEAEKCQICGEVLHSGVVEDRPSVQGEPHYTSLAVVFTAETMGQAEVMAAALRTQGFDVSIQDHEMKIMEPAGLGNTGWEVRVQVPEHQAEAARLAIAEMGASPD